MRRNLKFSSIDSLRTHIINMEEKDIHITHSYQKPVIMSKLLGLHSVTINGFTYQRPLRIMDFDGNLPSFRSSLRYPFILLKYFVQKFLKQYIVRNPKPFIVVDAVDYIEKYIQTGDRVLEVGAGNSTLWFLSKGCVVTSFEHNEEWAKAIVSHAINKKHFEKNKLKIEICHGPEAINKLEELDIEFDIILIDSMNEYTSRYEAIKVLREKLAPDGILILDNSDGPVNWKAMAEMKGAKNKKRFTGYAYNSPAVCQTTIWHKEDLLKEES